jgi:aminobenzoyl-glutamate utilization protein B
VAEELLGSRTYMVLTGLFRDVDAMLSCHISSDFSTGYGPSGSGLVSTEYTFLGRSAHSAAAPWAGRSALDALELMDIAWNFRREHLRPEHRSHYVIVEGGDQPNVVPPRARVWCFFREWDYERIRELHEIGSQMAAGQMTDATMSERVSAETWPGHFNRPLAEALYANIRRVGMPQWSEADQKLPRAAQAELKAKVQGLGTDIPELRPPSESPTATGSYDIPQISQTLPTAVLRFPGHVPGTTRHHSPLAIAMAAPVPHEGTSPDLNAQALPVPHLLLDPERLKKPKQYFAEQTRQTQWESLIADCTPSRVQSAAEETERLRPQPRKPHYDPAHYSSYPAQLRVVYGEEIR